MCITSDNQERREPSEQEENIVPAVDTVSAGADGVVPEQGCC